MTTVHPVDVDPWRLELVVVRGAARSSSERSSIARDVDRGLLRRLLPGAYVDAGAFGLLAPEQAHVVRLRALAAISSSPLVFSHWSAAVLHGLPVLRARLDRVHATVHEPAERRSGIADHVHPIGDLEVVRRHDLTATSAGRTAVDIAGATSLDEGVIAADAVLRAGVPRTVLESAVDLAGPRRAGRRIEGAVAFAHPGAESAAESRARVTAYRIGVEVPALQHRVGLAAARSAFLDEYFPEADAALEIDGDSKYLDPAMAPAGAGAAILVEKRREDEV